VASVNGMGAWVSLQVERNPILSTSVVLDIFPYSRGEKAGL
jgi:hypothetical protein